ncbi:MAG: NAD(P)-binding protein [Hyphomicrobiaceae bacterium]
MPRDIDRRDFLNGAALTIAAGLTPMQQAVAQAPRGAPYPPALTGMRGSTDASFKVIHGLALEGAKFDIDRLPEDESYDLVVVGAGLAGLTAAWSFFERRPKAKILILDNNDDFGGHARRTEHSVGGRTVIGYGGSESMVAPAAKFKGELARILKTLRIDTARFEQDSVFNRQLYPKLGLSRSVFFDKESFGRDKLVTGDPLQLGYDEFAPNNPGGRPIAAFLADCPLSDPARVGLIELFAGQRDYLADLTTEAKLERLQKTSYRAFLTEICKLPKEAANFFQGRSADNWGFGIDALGAIEMMGDGFPGAKSLKIEDKTTGNPEDKAPYVHHFPDGNASLARAMVRAMIKDVVPTVVPRTSMESLVTARFDYARLDRPGQLVRLRLNATVVRVANRKGGGVDIGYVTGGKLRRIRAAQTVVATSASVMPHICPEIGKTAADLMRSNVKAPLVYTKVAVRNWASFIKLGTHKISAPMGFHNTVKLDYPVSFGNYKYDADPRRPTVLHLVHVPGEPLQGLDMRDQSRAGRAKLLSMPFADFEKAVRRDLDRMLGPGGFDAGRDIIGVTVNRWSHGYSYTPSSLYDDLEALPALQEAMRAKLGDIAFANSDTGWDAYAHTAMAEAVRAIGELTGEKPPPYMPRWSERFRELFRNASTAPKAVGPPAKQ